MKEEIPLIVYNFLIFSFIITSLVFSIKGFFDLANDNSFHYFLMLENWRLPSITDILPVRTTTCPQNYSYLIPYEFGGTQEGCDCRGIFAYPDIQTGFCDYNQTLDGCRNISSLPGKAMPKWAGSTVWCVKREEGDTFMNRAGLVDMGGNCRNGYLKCGEGGKSQRDRMFCTSAKKCPINSFYVGQNPPTANDYEFSSTFDTEQGANYSLYVSRNKSNTLPVVEFRVSEEKVCLNNKVNYLSPSHKEEYPLMINRREKCSEFDERFSVLDSMTEKSYFEVNGLDFLEYILPNFQLSNSIHWNLYDRSYVDFKIECRYLMIELESNENLVSELRSGIRNLLIVLTVFLSIFLVFHMFTVKFPVVSFTGNYLLRLICLTCAAKNVNKAINYSNSFSNIRGMNCSDDIANNFFSDIGNEEKILQDMRVIIYFTIAFIAFDIILGLIWFLGYYLPKKLEEIFPDNPPFTNEETHPLNFENEKKPESEGKDQEEPIS